MEPYVLVTLVEAKGSVPQIAGAKAIVTANGLQSGTVGGGRIELKAIEVAQKLLAGPDFCHFARWNLVRDVGMTCGGTVSLFFECYNKPRWPIAVFGAGHVSQELVPLLTRLDCHVTCIDSRPEWLERLPENSRLTKICLAEPKAAVRNFSEQVFYILMTQGHKTDLPILAEILTHRSPPFLGVIGSKSKAIVLRRELREMGIGEVKALSFHCPVGLPIGNSTPAEIAISITAQLLQVRDQIKPSEVQNSPGTAKMSPQALSFADQS